MQTATPHPTRVLRPVGRSRYDVVVDDVIVGRVVESIDGWACAQAAGYKPERGFGHTNKSHAACWLTARYLARQPHPALELVDVGGGTTHVRLAGVTIGQIYLGQPHDPRGRRIADYTPHPDPDWASQAAVHAVLSAFRRDTNVTIDTTAALTR